MNYHCSKCGRFMKRIRDAMGLPLATGFPPDRPTFASSVPYGPFVCSNHREPGVHFDRVEYHPVGFQLY